MFKNIKAVCDPEVYVGAMLNFAWIPLIDEIVSFNTDDASGKEFTATIQHVKTDARSDSAQKRIKASQLSTAPAAEVKLAELKSILFDMDTFFCQNPGSLLIIQSKPEYKKLLHQAIFYNTMDYPPINGEPSDELQKLDSTFWNVLNY